MPRAITKKIGLTGGIASGKTAASNYFQKLRIPVIDADVISRDVVKPGTIGLQKLTEEFSKQILSENKLNRRVLRKIVFNNPEKLKKLNSILHPIIRNEIQNQAKKAIGPYCIISIPLLCETTEYQWLDRILVVDVSKETQIKRLLKRDQITLELAEKMIAQQCSRKDRLKIADDIINNEGQIEDLYENIGWLDKIYKQ